MTQLSWTGAIVALAGLVLLVFQRALGIGFCRFGKAAHRKAPTSMQFDEETLTRCYPDDRMPGYFMLIGIATLLGGTIAVIVGFVYS